MRGFRCIGRMHEARRDFDDSDILFFSPDEEGEQMRDGGIRARDFNFEACRVAAGAGLCPSDFVFVATALGEACFK